MKISEIKKLNDKELEEYLLRLYNTNACYECKEILEPHKKIRILASVTNKYCTSKTRTIGCLCYKCFNNFLENIDTKLCLEELLKGE